MFVLFVVSVLGSELSTKKDDYHWLHFMYDNDNSPGYIRKGPGTKPPRHYESTRYCILKTTMLVRDGYDLF